MSSGTLAGFLKLAAVGVAGVGLATGAYFAVQASQSEDNGPLLQVEATSTVALTPTVDLTPPQPTVPPPTPAIDISGWLTYVSPLGFEIKYPPTWIVQEWTEPPGFTKILNEARQETIAPLDPAYGIGVSNSGDAWIEIVPDAFPDFDAEGIIQSCQPADLDPELAALTESSRVTFAGLPAVRCAKERPSGDSRQLVGRTEGYSINLPSGRVLTVASYAFDGDRDTTAFLEAMLSTVSFSSTR